MLRGPGTAFVVVTISEGLGVSETDRIIDELEAHDLDVRRVVANKVLRDGGESACAYHRERAAMQAEYLAVVSARYAEAYGLSVVPQLPDEVKGLEPIETVAETLFADDSRSAHEFAGGV